MERQGVFSTVPLVLCRMPFLFWMVIQGTAAVATAISGRDTKPMGKKGIPVPVLYIMALRQGSGINLMAVPWHKGDLHTLRACRWWGWNSRRGCAPLVPI